MKLKKKKKLLIRNHLTVQNRLLDCTFLTCSICAYSGGFRAYFWNS